MRRRGKVVVDDATEESAAVARLCGVNQTASTFAPALDERAGLVERPQDALATAVACRALDILVSAAALVLLAPLLLAIAAAIRLDSRGRALFRQERIGRDMEPFVVNKFRTMHVDTANDEHRAFVERLIAGDAECHSALFKLATDDRVTRVGRVLRKTSLDELPQLINVLHGRMSLVGPRPCLDYEAAKYPPHAFGRFAVKPGMTGLWQVSGRSALSFEEMIALALEYARSRSLWLNVRILARTVPVVLVGKGAA